MKLGIDPGHGMGNRKPGVYDPGAGAGGHTEAEIVLAWGLALRDACTRAGIPVWMTRDDRTDVTPLGTRDNRAAASGCTRFISLHNNGSLLPVARGVETFYRDAGDKAWAWSVHRATVLHVASKDRGLKPEGETKAGRLAVLGFAGPACLVELGFISSPSDRVRLLDSSVRLKWAGAIVAAMKAS